MKKFSLILIAISSLTACGKVTDLNKDNLSAGIHTYLAKRGDLCLAKNVWPIDVTQKEIDAGGRNAIQMPALERLGLVKASVATVTASEDGRSAEILVRRYELSDEGKKLYLKKEMRSLKSDGEFKIQQVDFCVAKLSLDQVVGWEAQKSSAGNQTVLVNYTYKIDAAPWTQVAEIQRVFPMVARMIQGAGKVQLQETLKLTPQGWVALDL